MASTTDGATDVVTDESTDETQSLDARRESQDSAAGAEPDGGHEVASETMEEAVNDSMHDDSVAEEARAEFGLEDSSHDAQETTSDARPLRSAAAPLDPDSLEAWLDPLRDPEVWTPWARQLAERKQPDSITKLFPRLLEHPLLWSLPSSAMDEGSDELERLILSLGELRAKRTAAEPRVDWSSRIGDWCEHAEVCTATEPFAVECLAWAYALPRLVSRVDQEVWLHLIAVLGRRGLEAATSPIGFPSDREALIAQLLGGELLLALAYLFPKTPIVPRLATAARQLLNESLVELMDGEGVLRASSIAHWRHFLACWTRCFAIDRHVPGAAISKEAKLQFEWLVRQTLRFRRGEGHLILEQNTTARSTIDPLLRAALAIGGDQLDEELYAIATGRRRESSSSYELPPAGEHSEWAEASVLRNHWGQDATYLGLTFHESRFRCELGIGALRIWWGEAMPEVRIDGTKLESASEWEELCWEADEDGQYLELQMELTDGWNLQRQLYLPKKDGFLFFADAVLGPGRVSIDYRLTLPWTPVMRCLPQAETVDVELAGKKPFGWAMPLSLNEWKSAASRDGSFDGKTLHLHATGQALYAPIFFDLNIERRRRPRTWRQLTVAHELRINTRDEAVAYRVQIGDEQWAIYRSLAPPENRTFLGHNLISEFVLGRFKKDEGIVEPLIEIEQNENDDEPAAETESE